MPLVTLDDQDDRIPPASYDLIRLVDRLYPAECIKSGEDVLDAHRRAGRREVIDELVQWMRDEIQQVQEAKDAADLGDGYVSTDPIRPRVWPPTDLDG